MTVAAALASAVFAYLLVGYLIGFVPQLRLPRPRRRTDPARTQRWLAQAGAQLSVRQFWVASVALGTAVAVVVASVTGAIAVAVVPALTVGLLPRAYLARRRSVRLRAVQEAWPDGLRHLIAGLQAGQSLHQALLSLAETGPEPLRVALERYGVRTRAAGTVAALEVLREELADPTSDRVVEVLVLAHERGGRIVTQVLRDLAEATTTDVRVHAEIAGASLEQRLNARIVFVLPWLVLVLLTSSPGEFRDFYSGPGGLPVVAVAAVLSMVGIWVVSRLARDPGEERVFGPVTGGAAGPGGGDLLSGGGA